MTLPDPTYIYHRSIADGGDDLFEFAESGAVDEGCTDCVRLYTDDQLRSYAEEAVRMERAAFQGGIMTESQIEEAVALYNNTYCEERKGYMAGGNAERTAMRAVLDWAIRQEREAILESDP